jgi:hypothetical protein
MDIEITGSRPRPRWRLPLRIAAATLFGLTLLLAMLAVIIATSGVFDRRAGAWTVPLSPLPGVTVDANVAGLARLATSPVGLRVLDGRARTTRLGHLRLAREHDTLVLRCAPCRLTDARIATRTVALPAVELRLTRRAGIESNNLIDLRVRALDVEATAVATLSPTGISLAWTLPTVPVAALYRVVADAVPEARVARIDGQVQAQGTLALPALLARSDVRIDGFEVGGLTTERLQSGWFTHSCRAGDGSARTVMSGDGEAGWLDEAALGTLLPAAVLAAEDQRFLQHAGFDPVELTQVLAQVQLDDDASGSTPRGASTVTQQLARTLFTGGERTLARKLRELLYAVEMERTLGKARILQLYLNTVDWGPGLCGARAAARTYFNKRVTQLAPLEAAWLAGVLRAPHAAHERQFRVGRADRERAQWVLMQMRELPRAQRERALRQALAFAAPKRPRTESSTTRLAGGATVPAARAGAPAGGAPTPAAAPSLAAQASAL